MPLSEEYVIVAVEEERRLLIGDSICFGRFIVEAESLSHAAERCIEHIYIYFTVLSALRTILSCGSGQKIQHI